jgi:hypothetical protein
MSQMEMRWIPVEERPVPREGETILVTDGVHVAPMVRDVIHNNTGTPWDWQFGRAITAWMPLPPPYDKGAS